ncbi:tetratricopeptide repeat-containing sulfotransferase family protein [Paraglaciecola sp. 20A4]|uniref:tetratricopeptide repeat-containing sulfotransferase family protein n=1 Tax=Paraglaciecola sp. 20A4 TaxID=2687288 RepID=UPI001409936F|nr:tetratricopeptide repeat-containing sulfotransferase family protein [Paraglaciecola sp. 20A4]
MSTKHTSQASQLFNEACNGIKRHIQQAKFSQAIALCHQQLAGDLSNDNRIEILYLLVVAQRLNGDLSEALESNKTLLEANTKHARAWQENGYLYLALRETQLAAQSFYQATQLNPALLASWRALLPLYQQQENAKAVAISEAQIDYLAGLPNAVLGAKDLMYEGNLHSADKVCRQFLQANKHHPEAMLLLAEIGIQLKVYGEAEFILSSCLALYPEHKTAGITYLQLLAKMAKFAEAKALADKLLVASADNVVLLCAKASAMVGLGDVDEAIDIYQRLLKVNDDQPGIQLLLGHALKAMGDLPAAISAYQRAYQYKPEFGDAYWSLANTKTYRFSDDELLAMEQRVAQEGMGLDDKVHLHFALGQSLEDRHSFDAAFSHYAKGNLLKQQQINYNPEVFERQVAKQIETCQPELFARLKAAGEPSTDPIFIVGLPRAGSTLLEQILASHSQVDGTMELHDILGLASKLQGQKNQYPQILSELDESYFVRFGQKFLQDTRVYRQGARYFIDKMPNNFLHIGLIKLILPNAKVIDARREPMACCFSGFKQLFGDGQEFSYGLENIGRYYRAYEQLMAHWDTVLPGFVLRVQHETLIDDLQGQVKRILDFCALPFEQPCIDFHKTERAIKTPSSEQVRQPIYRSGMEQWKHFETHLLPLKKVLSES